MTNSLLVYRVTPFPAYSEIYWLEAMWTVRQDFFLALKIVGKLLLQNNILFIWVLFLKEFHLLKIFLYFPVFQKFNYNGVVQEKVMIGFESLMMNLKKVQWIVLDMLKDMWRPGVLEESWSESSFQRNWCFLGLGRMLSTSVNWDLFGILKRRKAGKFIFLFSLWINRKRKVKTELAG